MQSVAPILDLSIAAPDKQRPRYFALSVRGHSIRCTEVIARRDHVLIGISPFNSRFSPDYVASLLAWASTSFRRVDVLLPDEESAALLLIAAGTPVTKALRKTRKELNRHRRSLRKILDGMGEALSRTRIIEFADYFCNERYRQMKALAQDAFENCAEFRTACLEMSNHVLTRRNLAPDSLPRPPDPAEAALVAAPYILTEIPFYLCSADLLDTTSSVLAYHRPWPIGDALLSGAFPLSVDRRQGHGIVSIDAKIASDLLR